MTPEERWQRIEEKHLALAESVEAISQDVQQMQTMMAETHTTMVRMDQRERKTRVAILDAITAYLKSFNHGEEA